MTLQKIIQWLNRDERGQGLAEYALILSLIAVVAIAAVTFFGTQLSSLLSTIGVKIPVV